DDVPEDCLVSVSTVKVQCKKETAELVFKLRSLLDQVLASMVMESSSKPKGHSQFDELVLKAVTNLISAEDERLEVMNEDSDDSDRNDDGGLGIDGVGKTTILYKIVTGQTVNTIPTVGFNVEKFTHKKVSLSLWDTGRGGKMAPLMRHYYDGTKGIIFVIDSTDNEHIDEAEYELRRLVCPPFYL
ncbi:hypothetical protein MSG28_013261, partial [Choristoneura fumiferana]